MKEREQRIAEMCGITEKVQSLEKDLLQIDRVVSVDFDLDGFLEDGYKQIIFLTEYDIPGSLPDDDYWNARSRLRLEVLQIAKQHGLTKTEDRVEDYGRHFYWVFSCDKTWTESGMEDNKSDEQSLAEWKVVPGPGGWGIGWFVCSNCGQESAEDKEICPGCNSKMKQIKFF